MRRVLPANGADRGTLSALSHEQSGHWDQALTHGVYSQAEDLQRNSAQLRLAVLVAEYHGHYLFTFFEVQRRAADVALDSATIGQNKCASRMGRYAEPPQGRARDRGVSRPRIDQGFDRLVATSLGVAQLNLN